MARDIWNTSLADILPAWMRRHPAIGLTAAYLLVSVVGFAYSVLHYTQYGLNIVLFCEGSDFFLALFRHPVSLVASLFLAIWLFAIGLFAASPGERAMFRAVFGGDRERYAALLAEQGEALLAANGSARAFGAGGWITPASLTQLRATGVSAWRFRVIQAIFAVVYPLLMIGGLVLLAYFFVTVAENDAGIIMSGGGAEERFTVTADAGARSFNGVLVGTTNNFVFVWDRAGALVVYPTSSVGAIEISR